MIKGAFSNLFIQFLNKKNYRDIVLNLFRIANLEEDEALVDACIRDIRFRFLTLFPPSRICVYTCQFFVTVPHFECGRGYNRFDLKKFTVFSGTQKVGPICLTFIRGDPYKPHEPPEKVTFSD